MKCARHLVIVGQDHGNTYDFIQVQSERPSWFIKWRLVQNRIPYLTFLTHQSKAVLLLCVYKMLRKLLA